MYKPSLWLVVPAAGIGQRMKAECPKQYLKINNRFILDITLSRLLDNAPFKGCMVPLSPADHWWPDSESAKDDRIQTCTGGKERADSVLSALHALAEQADESDWVLVHDAARPCLHADDLSNLIDTLSEHPVGGLLAAPVADTLKLADDGIPPEVAQTVERSRLWRALTPQMFRFGALRAALESCLESGHGVTDESSAMEFSGKMPVLVEGRPDNLKVTVPSDLALAEFILGRL
ncbi:MAG: 2-C-methyl-D-erythritol 4-phosphate cytidylyltransferase [Marinobacter sp.]|uniref:2-C-methyl-D-erythritol 4-phosphate cytidylyltransferase n=1 Tax=Marinobacter sp. TaxID=50741 RepID=UPI0029C587E0|nr:2-C-methyl-D-erythritol 4-phosphate cytidylyltransferase [Marinobacter sp.]MDX5336582.1 2-C-methyl-D-erythritol 4-phosphate cytidylyltransferase [Marinobacter sp.]MDX5387722.1 2-C-methyl-D-erythritol 4-phosphate cytidylyltransferase [Marinobacter sp.]MDX5473028.1 2-C-methyl-D-erythritol 4-phosphate cytidylyltransferase [Marinobacter sp.]